ncbi:MAG TPA: hypothetical protein VGO06_07930 [Bosea sp. (in: a-proteobacteria)]|jgi:hypothetical protein|uniref:hypothetical protein n=1 Tax=Bosea sp. (in: a-proteobacteria) TaxID=1871050 RepID=UPI002E122137|nr:hypothetical protein [Bosea sp. (in: a-proteobacteria)]
MKRAAVPRTVLSCPMKNLRSHRLAITDATNIALTGGPECGAVVTLTGLGGALIELHLTAEALASIEVLLEGARMAQAKIYGVQ